MQTWHLQKAKSHLSEVLRLCVQNGPQLVTAPGKEEAVIMSKKDDERLIGKKMKFVDFMRASPLNDLDICLERDHSPNRNMGL